MEPPETRAARVGTAKRLGFLLSVALLPNYCASGRLQGLRDAEATG